MWKAPDRGMPPASSVAVIGTVLNEPTVIPRVRREVVGGRRFA